MNAIELIVGYDDPTTLKHVPGLRDDFEAHERLDDERFKRLFLWFKLASLPLFIVTLEAVGVPTKELVPLLQRITASVVGTIF